MKGTKKHFYSVVLLLFVSINGFSQQSKTDLIIGNWIMDGKEYIAQMSLKFKKDSSSILERLVNNKSTLKVEYKYKFSENQDYLHLDPTESSEKKWKIKIIQLDYQTLKLQSQSPDSSVLILHRVKE
ncbi:MAG: hypothetical protein ABIN67_16230 [Ferruginibacter sp.]